MIEVLLMALLIWPQTQAEMLAEEEAVYERPDVSLPIELTFAVPTEKVIVAELRVVDSDRPFVPVMTGELNHYLEVRFTATQPRGVHPDTASLSGIWATFNPQFQIGKNTFSWTTDVCNYTQGSLTYDGAMISQIGEMSGNLSRVSPAEAENEANAWRNKTLPVEGVDALSLVGHWMTIIGAAGVFAISPHGIAILALSTKLAEDGANWLKTKEPLAFLQRFPINTWLTGPMLLAPRSCIQDRVLFSRRVRGAHTFSAQLP